MRTCPVLDAEENVLFVLVADGGQVGDSSWQVAAFLTAQHSTELDSALERHVVNFTHIRQMATLLTVCPQKQTTARCSAKFLASRSL